MIDTVVDGCFSEARARRLPASAHARQMPLGRLVNRRSLSLQNQPPLALVPPSTGMAVGDVPLGRFGDAEVDIGRPIARLTTDEARFITSSIIMLDGGQMQLR